MSAASRNAALATAANKTSAAATATTTNKPAVAAAPAAAPATATATPPSSTQRSSPAAPAAVTELIRNIVIGGSAGVIGQTVVYPMYNIKTRLQREPERYRNAYHCMRKVLQHEGVLGLYRGLQPAFLGVFFEKAIKLSMNDTFRRRLAAPDGSVSLPMGVLAGAGAGFCQVIVTNPMEMTMIQMTPQSSPSSPKNNPVSAAVNTTTPQQQQKQQQQHRQPKSMVKVVRSLGLAGLYRGTASTLLRDVPFSGIFFSLRELMNQWFADKNGVTPKSGIFIGGLASGCIAAVASTPMDVIKTRLQAQAGIKHPPSSNPPAPLTIRSCAKLVYETQGIRGFFNGAVPRLLIISPLFGITMVFYQIFGEQTSSKK